MISSWIFPSTKMLFPYLAAPPDTTRILVRLVISSINVHRILSGTTGKNSVDTVRSSGFVVALVVSNGTRDVGTSGTSCFPRSSNSFTEIRSNGAFLWPPWPTSLRYTSEGREEVFRRLESRETIGGNVVAGFSTLTRMCRVCRTAVPLPTTPTNFLPTTTRPNVCWISSRISSDVQTREKCQRFCVQLAYGGP